MRKPPAHSAVAEIAEPHSLPLPTTGPKNFLLSSARSADPAVDRAHGTIAHNGAERGKKKKKRRRTPQDPNPQVFTIKTFCLKHAISAALYFKLKAEKKGPREMQVGRRVLISKEAAREWRLV